MDSQALISDKKRRGPAPTGQGHPILVRLHPTLLDFLDQWTTKFNDASVSRPEAIRIILSDFLLAKLNGYELNELLKQRILRLEADIEELEISNKSLQKKINIAAEVLNAK